MKGTFADFQRRLCRGFLKKLNRLIHGHIDDYEFLEKIQKIKKTPNQMLPFRHYMCEAHATVWNEKWDTPNR